MLLISTLAALSVGAVANGSTTEAATGCTVTAPLPARVLIDRPDVVVTTRVVTDCTNFLAASYLNGPSGNIGFFDFDDNTRTQTANFSAYSDKTGTYRTVDTGNNFADQGAVNWISTSTTFKYVTLDYISSKRVGRAVYINGLVKNYSDTFDGLVRGTGRVTYLQRHLASGWQTMLERTTNSTGQISVGFIPSAVQQYRLITSETATAWSGFSGSTVR